MRLGNNRGFTLTELIMTIAVLGVIMVPVSLVLIQGYQSYYVESDSMDAQREAREIMYGDGVTSHGIIGVLRENDGSAVNVQDYKDQNGNDTGETNVMSINGNIYTFDANVTTLQISGAISGSYGNVTAFKVGIITKGTQDGNGNTYDNNMVNVSVSVKIGRGREITVKSSYGDKTDN